MEPRLLLLAGGRLLQGVGAIVAFRFLTDLLATREIALYYLLNAILAVAQAFLVTPCRHYLRRHLFTWLHDGTLTTRLTRQAWLFLAFAAVAGLLTLAANRLAGVGAGMGASQLALLIGFGTLVSSGYLLVMSLLLLLLEQTALAVGLVCAAEFSGLALAIALAQWQPSGAWWLTGLLAGQLVAAGIGCLVLLRLARRYGTHKPALGSGEVRRALAFIVPTSALTGLFWFMGAGYRLQLEQSGALLAIAQLGLGMAGACGIMVMAEAIIFQYRMPGYQRAISASDVAGRARAFNDLAQHTLPFFGVLAAFIAALAPFIERILFAGRYPDTAQVIAIGVLAELGRIVATTYSNVGHAELRPQAMLLAGGAGALVLAVALAMTAGAGMAPATGAACIAGGWLVTALLMQSAARRLSPVRFGRPAVARAIALAAPAAAFLPAQQAATSLGWSLAACLLAGIYLLGAARVLGVTTAPGRQA